MTIAQLSETSYRVAGLAGFNAAEGTYVLTVDAGAVTDVSGNPGQGSASIVWAVSTSHLAVVSAGGFGGRSLRGPVPAIDVVFSAPVNPASFTLAVLSLTRNGGSNLLGTGVTITQTANNTFHIGGLAALTAAPGAYAFIVFGSMIADATGQAGVGLLTETFTIDSLGPVIQSLEAISPNPRNAPVSALNVVLFQAYRAFQLRRHRAEAYPERQAREPRNGADRHA